MLALELIYMAETVFYYGGCLIVAALTGGAVAKLMQMLLKRKQPKPQIEAKPTIADPRPITATSTDGDTIQITYEGPVAQMPVYRSPNGYCSQKVTFPRRFDG
jgi:hypothetical protein